MTDPAAPAITLMAMSLDIPHVSGHPNRMPFSGILTRIDVASDKPPHGSNGRRVLLTRGAAEAGLGSLLGMGVDLTKDLDGHDAQKKVGIITDATIDGDALRISGFIYASDFPREALRIHLNQSDLGFSFEASNLAVESMETDPLIIKSCCFTGAAILMKDDAAYTTTALAAAAAKEHEMDEVTAAVTAAVNAALAPISTTLAELQATQAAQGTLIADIKKTPPTVVQAAAPTIAMVEPHATKLETAADEMERAGLGIHATAGHVSMLRRMAGSMRADAAVGRMPHAYHDSGSYYASATPPQQQQVQHAAPPAPKIEDMPEFKALQTKFEEQSTKLQASADAAASLETKVTDLTAKITGMRPEPTRKTLTPDITALLARAGITPPEGEGGGLIPIAKIDAALAGMPDMDIGRRMILKTRLRDAGLISPQ